jgi:branched-chain amino acid transport system permease protein
VSACRLARALEAPLLLIALLAFLALAGQGGGEVFQRTVLIALITVTLVVGLYAFVGNTGIVSFGHLAFVMVGAYITATLTIPVALKSTLLTGLPSWLASAEPGLAVALLASALGGALVAALFAWPVMRLTGLAASIATLAMLVIVHAVASNWDEVTRGTAGAVGVPIETTTGLAFALAAVSILVAYAFQRSSVGRRLRAARDDEAMARSVGIGVSGERRLAFGLSAAIMAAGGGAYAAALGAFSPETFYLGLTLTTIAMLVVGGMHSLSGAVIGSLLISLMQELLRRLEEGATVGFIEVDGPAGIVQLATAALLLAIMILRPEGVTGGAEISLRGPLDRRPRRSGKRTLDGRAANAAEMEARR